MPAMLPRGLCSGEVSGISTPGAAGPVPVLSDFLMLFCCRRAEGEGDRAEGEGALPPGSTSDGESSRIVCAVLTKPHLLPPALLFFSFIDALFVLGAPMVDQRRKLLFAEPCRLGEREMRLSAGGAMERKKASLPASDSACNCNNKLLRFPASSFDCPFAGEVEVAAAAEEEVVFPPI